MKIRFNQKAIYLTLAFLIPFIVYIYTLAPDVMFIDAGELAVSATKLGIAHPTGYPLFTLLGNLFSKIPLADEIFRLNLMSAFISSITVLIFFILMVFILTDLNLNEGIKNNNKGIPVNIIYNISLASAFILAFSKTFWDSANSIEVYSLHSFFLVTNIFLFLKAVNIDPKDQLRDKYWIIFSFVLGLSFTNHLTTIFLSVAFLYLYFMIYGFNQTSLKFIMRLAIPFLLGYSLYIYLLIRADNLIISWGDPDTFDNFLKHIWGKQFTNLMFGSTEIAGAQLSYFVNNFPLEFFYIPLILIIPGIIEIRRQSRRLFIFTLLLFAFNILYAINYNIFDIDTYFLLVFIVTSIWIGYGLLFIVKKFKERSNALSYVAILVFLIPLTQNFSANNKRNDYTVREYVNNIYKSAPSNSIIFTTQWNYLVAPTWYYQLVKNERPDLIIINKEQLSERWYIDHIKNRYPELLERSKPELYLYLNELTKFEGNNLRYTSPQTQADNQEIIKFQTTFKNLLNSIVDKNSADKNIFSTYEIEEDKQTLFAKDYKRIPEGLLFRYSKEKNYVDYVEPEFEFVVPTKNDYYHDYIAKSYLQSYLVAADYLMQNSKYDEAEHQISKALNVNPNSPEAKQYLVKINQLRTTESK